MSENISEEQLHTPEGLSVSADDILRHDRELRKEKPTRAGYAATGVLSLLSLLASGCAIDQKTYDHVFKLGGPDGVIARVSGGVEELNEIERQKPPETYGEYRYQSQTRLDVNNTDVEVSRTESTSKFERPTPLDELKDKIKKNHDQ